MYNVLNYLLLLKRVFVIQCASLEEQQSVNLTDRLAQSSTVMLK